METSISPADESFELIGPVALLGDNRSITGGAGADPIGPDIPFGSFDASAGDAAQKSEATTYWLSGEGSASGAAESVYGLDFNLTEGTDYQLCMILDGRDGGEAWFDLSGPTSISYHKTPGG